MFKSTINNQHMFKYLKKKYMKSQESSVRLFKGNLKIENTVNYILKITKWAKQYIGHGK